MAHAPFSTCFAPHGDGSARGCFRHAETKVHFDFTAATEAEQVFGPEFDMKVWVMHEGYRLAKVLKTVAHVVVDEDEHGRPVTERWLTRRHERFTDPNR